jgi:hypothetical protein
LSSIGRFSFSGRTLLHGVSIHLPALMLKEIASDTVKWIHITQDRRKGVSSFEHGTALYFTLFLSFIVFMWTESTKDTAKGGHGCDRISTVFNTRTFDKGHSSQ